MPSRKVRVLPRFRQADLQPPPLPAPDIPRRGAFSRETGWGNITQFTTNNPAATLAGGLERLYLWNTGVSGGLPTYDATKEANLVAAIEAAETNGSRLLVRVLGGADDAIGRPGTARPEHLFTDATHPVNRIRTFNNEQSAVGEEIFVPDWINSWQQDATGRWIPTPGSSADHYFWWYRKRLERLRDIFAADTPGGFKRYQYVHMVPVWAPTESGSEATLGTGTAPTYSGTAKAGAIGATGNFSLTSGQASIPDGTWCLKINDATGNPLRGFELVHATKSGNSITVLKRGHSGTLAVSHASGKTILRCIQQSGKEAMNTATYDGYPASGGAPYDHKTQNTTAWDSISGSSSVAADRATFRSDRTMYAWKYAIDMHMDVFQFDVHAAFAGGHIMSDSWVRSREILQQKAGEYGHRLVAMTTNLQATATQTYAQIDPEGHNFFLLAASSGCLVGAQTAAVSILANGQDLVRACEDSLVAYVKNGQSVVHFIETQPERFNNASTFPLTAYLGWPNTGNYTVKQYMLTASGNLQSRLPEA